MIQSDSISQTATDLGYADWVLSALTLLDSAIGTNKDQ
jgi:hypothetical protein